MIDSIKKFRCVLLVAQVIELRHVLFLREGGVGKETLSTFLLSKFL